MANVKVLKPIPGYSYFEGDTAIIPDDMADFLSKKKYVEIAVVNRKELTREKKEVK